MTTLPAMRGRDFIRLCRAVPAVPNLGGWRPSQTASNIIDWLPSPGAICARASLPAQD